MTITKQKNHRATQESGKIALSSFNRFCLPSAQMGTTAANVNVSPLAIAPSPLPAAPPPPPSTKPPATQETGKRKGRRPPKEGAAVGSNGASITTVTVQRGSLQLFHDRNCLQKLRKRIYCLSDSRTSSSGGVFLSIICKTKQRAHQRKTLQIYS